MMVSPSMAETGQQRIFVSYARLDGAELALRLQTDLTAAGLEVWLDTQRIAGGASWTVEIEEAIDRPRWFSRCLRQVLTLPKFAAQSSFDPYARVSASFPCSQRHSARS